MDNQTGHSNSAHRFARRWIFQLVANLASAGGLFAMQLVVARALGIHSYGHYIYAASIAQAVTGLANGGLETVSLRFVAQYDAAGQSSLLSSFLRYCLRSVFLLGVVGGLIMTALAFCMPASIDAELRQCLYCAAGLVPIATVTLVTGSVLLATGRSLQVSAANGATPLLLLTLTLLAQTVGPGCSAPGLLILQITASAVVMAVQLTTIRHRIAIPPCPNAQRAGWRSAAAEISVVTVMGIIQNTGATLLSGALLDTDQAAVYVTAVRIATLVLHGNTAVGQIVSPRFAALYASGNMLQLQRVARFAAFASTGFTLAVATPLVVIGPQLLGLFGDKFASCYGVLLILLFNAIVNGSAGSTGMLLYMTGNQRASARIYAISSITGFALTVILIPLFGLYGAALASTLTAFLWNGMILHFVRSQLGIWSGIGPSWWGVDESQNVPAATADALPPEASATQPLPEVRRQCA